MTCGLKILGRLLEEMHRDLSRPHPFAAERVGFLTCGIGSAADEEVILLGHRWHGVADDDYVPNPSVGAEIGGSAFRKILQFAYQNPVAVLHVHRHHHHGKPAFSPLDMRSSKQFVPSFFNVRRDVPHGVLVLSLDHATGLVWYSRDTAPREIGSIHVVGIPIRKWA